MVLGILGVIMVLPLIGPILALVFGYQSRREAAAYPEWYRDDLGQVGRILGWIGLVLTLLLAGGIVTALVWVFAALPNWSASGLT